MKCPDCNIQNWKTNPCETYCGKCGYVSDEAPVNYGRERFAESAERASMLSRSGQAVSWLNPFSQAFTTFNPRKKKWF